MNNEPTVVTSWIPTSGPGARMPTREGASQNGNVLVARAAHKSGGGEAMSTPIEVSARKANLYWNENGYIVRSKLGDRAVGFSSISAVKAVEEAEGNGFEVYWCESPVRHMGFTNLPDFNRKPMFT